MALTDAQTAWLTDELGSPLDADVGARYEALGSIRDVAIAVWRARRAKLIQQPASVSIPGVASVNFGANIKAMDERITALLLLDTDPTSDPGEPVDGAGSVWSRAQLVRTRRR